MARKANADSPDTEKTGRSFKPDATAFKTLAEGESFRGVLIGTSFTEITDKRTRAPKTLHILKLRGEDEQVHKFPMAAMMKRAWEDICDQYGGGDEDATVKQLRGAEIEIIRGKDTRTTDRNPMGTYEIVVFE